MIGSSCQSWRPLRDANWTALRNNYINELCFQRHLALKFLVLATRCRRKKANVPINYIPRVASGTTGSRCDESERCSGPKSLTSGFIDKYNWDSNVHLRSVSWYYCMYNVKSTGSSTAPCGTPRLIFCQWKNHNWQSGICLMDKIQIILIQIFGLWLEISVSQAKNLCSYSF